MDRTLTQRQCSRLFGADRLADIVFQLRKTGMNIDTIWTDGQDRFGNDVHFATYKWLGEVPKINYTHRDSRGIKKYLVTHRFPMAKKKMMQHIRDYLTRHKAKIQKNGMRHQGNSVEVKTNAGKRIFLITQAIA